MLDPLEILFYVLLGAFILAASLVAADMVLLRRSFDSTVTGIHGVFDANIPTIGGGR